MNLENDVETDALNAAKPTTAPSADDMRELQRRFAREVGQAAFYAWADWVGLHPHMLDTNEGEAQLRTFDLAYDRQVQVLRDRARLAVTQLYDSDRQAGRLSNPEMLLWAEEEAMSLFLILWARIFSNIMAEASKLPPPGDDSAAASDQPVA